MGDRTLGGNRGRKPAITPVGKVLGPRRWEVFVRRGRLYFAFLFGKGWGRVVGGGVHYQNGMDHADIIAA